MARWTKNNIPNLSGKVIIITGANSGLGLASTKAFSEQGATVIMACRSMEKGELAKASVGDVKGELVLMHLDLEEEASIRSFARAFKARYVRLDVLLNNAGIMQQPYELSEFGVERQLSVNHLSHFLLTSLLLDPLIQTAKSRVVNVSSLAHRKGVFDFTDINYASGKNYDPMVAYRRSKLANLLFTFSLQDFFEKNALDVIALSAHPGVAPTNLMNHKFSQIGRLIIRPLAKLFLQRVRIGALAQIRAAVDPKAQGGHFYGPSSNSEWRGYPVLVDASEESRDSKLAKELWDFSIQKTGADFHLPRI